MVYDEINDLYCQCGNYLLDCKEYEKILEDRDKEYIEYFFNKIDLARKDKNVEKLTSLLIEIRKLLFRYRYNIDKKEN